MMLRLHMGFGGQVMGMQAHSSCEASSVRLKISC